MSRGRWFGETDWSRFCTRKPTDIEIDLWSKWPEAGIGVCMGAASGNLAAIDVDTDNGAVQRAIESVIEPSPVQKTGRTGFTAFYRANPIVESTSFNIVGERALDLLCSGRQTVLPPSQHPEAGRPYIWQTMATLEDTSPDLLPLLPDDIADRLGSVLAPFGFLAPVERPHADSDGGIWREVNDVALQRLSDWVPHLGIDAKRNGNGNWRGVALWRGGDGHNVSFSEQGIRDFAAGTGMTALDTVMAANTCDFATAEKWLRQRLGFKEPPPVVFRSRPRVVEALEPPKPAPVYAPLAKVDPFDPKAAGGLLEMTANWIYSISIRPSRELSMLSAISIMAAFAGRRYVSPTGLATNLYLCGVAATGVGKDAPLNAPKNLFLEMGGQFSNWIGSGDISSDAAIEVLIRTKPACLFTLDEIGSWLQISNGKFAKEYAVRMRKSLLSLFSLAKAGQYWLGKDTAGAKVLSSSQPIYSPCLTVLGVSTEESFFEGLSHANLKDGLIARMTLVHVGRGGDPQRIPWSPDPPQQLIGAYRDALSNWPKAGSLTNTNMNNPHIKPALFLVDWDNDEVRNKYENFEKWQVETIRENKAAEGYMSRAAEQALKLAMIRSISIDAVNPKITMEDWDFGQSFVSRSIDMMEIAVDRYMFGSEWEENWKKAREFCRQAGAAGLKQSDLWRKPEMSKLDQDKRKKVVQFLSTTGKWEPRSTGKRGCRFFYVADGDVVEEE